MYLSRLDLHGFKSFARKTAVEFAPGVTAIVGPNGCGKSNVIDAVRWVLGEQRARTLRSDSMAGVIFNGAEGARALGLAEVSLTVQNDKGVLPTEYGEVVVTRRLYRSGDSEYLLNGTTCRLRDVLDLFMDTGLGAGAYSVIELSMVEDILSDNASDRRRLFEEAAGVTKYKRRRAQALRKLDATQADLTRVDDIVEEVEKQVRSLQRQAQKAQRHARYAERLRRLDLGLAAHDHQSLQAERDAKTAEARAHADRAGALGAELAAGEAALEADRAALADAETARAAAQRTLADHLDTVRALDAQIAVRAERRQADARALDRLGREAETDAARADALAAETEAIADRTAQAGRDAEQTAAALATADTARSAAAAATDEARRTRDAAAAELRDAEAALRDAASARDRALALAAARDAERQRLDDARAALDGRGAGDAATLASAATAARDALDAAAAALDAARAAEAVARQAAEAAADRHAAARAAQHAAAAQTELLRSLAETGEGAAAFLSTHPDWHAPTVAELVACADGDALAVEAALGAWAGAFVVDTEADADAAIGRLRAEGAGRATFVVQERLGRAPRERSATPPGATPVLSLVRADADHRALVERVLADAFLVDSLAAARDLRDAYPVARFVTRGGAWTDALGALHGGSADGDASARLGRAERLASADAVLARAETALGAAAADLASARQARDRAVQATRDAEASRDVARRTHDAAAADLARAAALAQAADDERSRLDARAAALADAPAPDAALDGAVETAETVRAAAHAAHAAAAQAFDAAEAERAAAETAWADARLAHARSEAEADAARRDAERATAARAELDVRAERRTAEADAVRARLATDEGADSDTRAELDAARQDTDALRTRAEDAETAVLTARAAIADAEAALRETRSAREAATSAHTALELRLAEISTRQDTLLERLHEEHEATLGEAAEALDRLQTEELFQPETARTEAPALRRKIRDLGPVNALALESYDEETERLGFLREQRQDLADAEATLLETIDAINTTARERFGETFAQVREAFGRLFAELFGDTATADLALDGDDPLEAPVVITARPKGKKPVSLAQLSGGEKTLTATALLFAIYLVKPSPFCILDEVDAPLDDANVERFMRLIRSFADSTQFILVTHNKLTMEAADRMYGVTMPTPGISRLVGVDLGGAGGDGATAEAGRPAPETEGGA